MKVLLINGSPHKDGNTFIAISEIAKSLKEEAIKTQIVHIGNRPMQGCIACYQCKKTGECIFKDEVYHNIKAHLRDSDGLIVGSPVYFASPNGSLCALLDRIFYSCSALLSYKPAASVVVCRRGGASAAFDRLNKYFTISNMPVVSSQYWNSVHGLLPGEAVKDEEGLQTMRKLGKNMAWVLKNIKSGNVSIPDSEPRVSTNFIR